MPSIADVAEGVEVELVLASGEVVAGTVSSQRDASVVLDTSAGARALSHSEVRELRSFTITDEPPPGVVL